MHISRFSQINLFILVFLLHVSGFLAVWQVQAAFSPPQPTPPQAMITAVLLAPEPVPVPPAPTVAPEPEPQPPPPKPVVEPPKPKPKPVVQPKPQPPKPKPVLKPTPERVISDKTVTFKASEPEKPQATPPKVVEKVEEAEVKSSESPRETAQDSHASRAASASASSTTDSAPPKITAPQFNAAYLNNPAPAYPASARRMGETGRVLLRVYVTAGGLAGEVQIQRSSGVEDLDDAALEAVRRWKFVPAKQGDTAIAAWVNVPINFTLN